MYKYVTIEREYGSAGTEIATKLAKECGIPCYGKEILEELSRKAGMSVDKLEQYEEDATGSFLYSLYVMTKVQSGDTDYTDLKGKVYIAEQKIIKEFANEGPAVFLGHCAYEALATDRMYSVYLFTVMKTIKKNVSDVSTELPMVKLTAP